MRFGKADVRMVALVCACAFHAPMASAGEAAPDVARYPSKVVRLVIGFTAGGAADVQVK